MEARRSTRRSQRRTLNPERLQNAVALHHERYSLKALGLVWMKYLQLPMPVQRHEWAQREDMIHIDIKPLARFDRVGHRVTGDQP